jgi:hypothetical protein
MLAFSSAADGYRKILFAEDKAEMALQISGARQSGLSLNEVWEVFLKQPNRPDSGTTTLKKYNSHFRNFLNWCKANHPETDKAAFVDNEENYVLPAVARRYKQTVTKKESYQPNLLIA